MDPQFSTIALGKSSDSAKEQEKCESVQGFSLDMIPDLPAAGFNRFNQAGYSNRRTRPTTSAAEASVKRGQAALPREYVKWHGDRKASAARSSRVLACCASVGMITLFQNDSAGFEERF